MDPQSPTTTPVWDAKGKLSNVVIAKGRGNTKKLAKNDGAKDLVLRLQEGLSGSRHAHSIPNLAKELARQQKEMNDWKNEEVQVSSFDKPCSVDKLLACCYSMQDVCRRTRFVESIITLPIA